jgi:hypothetical protein
VLYGYELLTLVELVLLVFCVLDVVTTPEDAVRNLPKLLWLLLVVVLPLVGGVAWLVAGRPAPRDRRTPARGAATRTRAASAPPPTTPDDDEAFLRSLRERAERQRRTAAEQRRRAESERAERDEDDRPV